MRPYDPNRAPEVEEWLAADEQERIEAVRRHHETARIRVPSLDAHAALHAVVETQLAEHVYFVEDALERLRADGLDRHDAIHAISSVLITLFHQAKRLAAERPDVDLNVVYRKDLEKLTAASWKKPL